MFSLVFKLSINYLLIINEHMIVAVDIAISAIANKPEETSTGLEPAASGLVLNGSTI